MYEMGIEEALSDMRVIISAALTPGRIPSLVS